MCVYLSDLSCVDLFFSVTVNVGQRKDMLTYYTCWPGWTDYIRAWEHHGPACKQPGRKVGRVFSASAWLDGGFEGSVCLFDKKSSVRKENKQCTVLLLLSRRKSGYWNTTQYLDCWAETEAHRHTHDKHWEAGAGMTVEFPSNVVCFLALWINCIFKKYLLLTNN